MAANFNIEKLVHAMRGEDEGTIRSALALFKEQYIKNFREAFPNSAETDEEVFAPKEAQFRKALDAKMPLRTNRNLDISGRLAELRSRAAETRNADEVALIYVDIANLKRAQKAADELAAPVGRNVATSAPAFEIRAGETDIEFRERAARELATRAF